MRSSTLALPLHSQGWWAAFLETRYTFKSVEIAVAMAAQSETLTYNLLDDLPDDLVNTCVNEVFGDPLINAIKLQDLGMFGIVAKYVENRIDAHTMKPQPRNSRPTWFPVQIATRIAILYNQPAMVATLLDLHYKQFGRPAKAVFSGWMDSTLHVGKVSIVLGLYIGHLPKPFELNASTIADVCHTGTYDMVTACVDPLVQDVKNNTVRHNPIHIAVMYTNCGTVMALDDMGKIDNNQLATHHKSFKDYLRESVAPIDIASFNKDIGMLKLLLKRGANFRRRFTTVLTGPVYYTIRDWAMKPKNGGSSRMSAYGMYRDKSEEDRVDTIMG